MSDPNKQVQKKARACLLKKLKKKTTTKKTLWAVNTWAWCELINSDSEVPHNALTPGITHAEVHTDEFLKTRR